jgi:hypothetical protein
MAGNLTSDVKIPGFCCQGGREIVADSVLVVDIDVRKLKALGLTESLGTGYRLSPRGRAWLASH